MEWQGMLEENRFGRKEWAGGVKALAAPHPTILLRKGGAENEALPFSSGIGDAD